MHDCMIYHMTDRLSLWLQDKAVDGKVRQKTLGALEHTFRAQVHEEKQELM